MFKQIIIIFVVIVFVISLDVISNNYLEKAVDELSKELTDLKEELLKEEYEKSIEQMKKIKNKWEEKYDILAYYIEHDELEKVETELVRLSADIDMKEYKHCINELNTAIFILEHIEQKEKFDITSIF